MTPSRISPEASKRGFCAPESTNACPKVSKVVPEEIGQKRANIPRLYRRVYDQAMSGASRQAAIQAFCLECVGWQRAEIPLCPSQGCPLYPYRPYQQGGDEAL